MKKEKRQVEWVVTVKAKDGQTDFGFDVKADALIFMKELGVRRTALHMRYV